MILLQIQGVTPFVLSFYDVAMGSNAPEQRLQSPNRWEAEKACVMSPAQDQLRLSRQGPIPSSKRSSRIRSLIAVWFATY